MFFLLSSLVTEGTCEFGSGPRYFRTTVDAQIAAYGKVIREAAFNSRDAYLLDIQDRITMTATELYTTVRSDIEYGWRVRAALNTSDMVLD